MQSLARSLSRRRHNRYYQLPCLFSVFVHAEMEKSSGFVPPTPWTIEDFDKEHAPLSSPSLTNVWMQQTDLEARMSYQLKSLLEVRRAIRMDHTVKFPKRLRDWDGQGVPVNIADIRMLLLVQNELGQVIGHAFTRSENNEETMAELTRMLTRCRIEATSREDQCIPVISDNANAVRGLIEGLSTESTPLTVKHDPFYVIQRFTAQVKSSYSKTLAKELSEAMYTLDRELHEPEIMAANFASVIQRVPAAAIHCTPAKWNGSLESNLKQIRRGNVYTETNCYEEAGNIVKIISTSQVEGFNSSLKRLIRRSVSVPLGVRVLDLHVLKHNLSVGSRFGRTPDIGYADLLWVCRSAILGDRVCRSSPQQEFALRLLAVGRPATSLRNPTTADYDLVTWECLFPSIEFDSDQLKQQLGAQRRNRANIRDLLLAQGPVVNDARIRSLEFFRCLNLTSSDSESARDFTPTEPKLLHQI